MREQRCRFDESERETRERERKEKEERDQDRERTTRAPCPGYSVEPALLYYYLRLLPVVAGAASSCLSLSLALSPLSPFLSRSSELLPRCSLALSRSLSCSLSRLSLPSFVQQTYPLLFVHVRESATCLRDARSCARGFAFCCCVAPAAELPSRRWTELPGTWRCACAAIPHASSVAHSLTRVCPGAPTDSYSRTIFVRRRDAVPGVSVLLRRPNTLRAEFRPELA